MKANADPLSVEFTFTEFHQFVEAVTEEIWGKSPFHGGGRSNLCIPAPATSVWGCPQRANRAGGIQYLSQQLSTPIRMRAGIHSGDSTPTPDDIKSLNFAHVIDVAAHLQHCCPPGGIAVSEEAAKMLPQGPISVGPKRIETEIA